MIPADTHTSPFPASFAWGAATAAYQIEGVWDEEGKGPSVWDMMCQKAGAVFLNHHGQVACDHFHHWREDVGLMKDIGLKAYRFSVSWPRVVPEGTGKINEAGLGFYDRLVDHLLESGIEPYLTLFHWDFPLGLYQSGGWLNRESAQWFGECATLMGSRLGDRIKHWITLNEPQCFVGLGHHEGLHAPGDKLEISQVLRVVHNVLIAHGTAVQALRAACPGPIRIGMASASTAQVPATESLPDIEAAREVFFGVRSDSVYNIGIWADPIHLGEYPAEAYTHFKEAMPKVAAGDMETIRQPLDFIGFNSYTGCKVSRDPDGKPHSHPKQPGNPVGTLG